MAKASVVYAWDRLSPPRAQFFVSALRRHEEARLTLSPNHAAFHSLAKTLDLSCPDLQNRASTAGQPESRKNIFGELGRESTPRESVQATSTIWSDFLIPPIHRSNIGKKAL